MWIKREIEPVLSEIASQYPVCVLTGTRQVGKTSLLTHSFPELAYASLDVPYDAARAEEQSGLFLEQLGQPCLIDEVQYAPSIFRSIKAAVDKRRPQKGLYYLTGSERYHLMNGVSESLAGRAAIIELLSLSHRELERATGKQSSGQQLVEWMWKGGYPALYSENIPTQRFYSNLLATYIERDVRRLANVQNIRDFDRFMRLAALRTGQLLSMNALAAEVGVSQTTIKGWIGVLESSGIITLVEPWHSNRSKRLIKTPKLYFMDTGLCCYLIGLASPAELQRSVHLGAIFETHTFGQLVRAYTNRGLRYAIYFFRTHDGEEVDFVLQSGSEFDLIECKWSEQPSLNFRGHDAFAKVMPQSIRSLSLISSQRQDLCKDRDRSFWIRNSIDWDFLFQR